MTDEHAAAIAESKTIETLQFGHFGNSPGSPLTDAGLEHLARLPKLKELTLLRTKITPAGLARFRTAKPNVKITTDVKEP